MPILDLYLAFCLATMGFVVGILSGFLGFGGGFILTPFLLSLGVPANIAVGTNVMQIFMSSAVAAFRHKHLGNVDLKLSVIIAAGSIFGAELGAQAIEYFEKISVQHLNALISLIYIIILTLTSAYMIYEASKPRHHKFSTRRKLSLSKIFNLKIPPMITLSQPGIAPKSLWAIILLGLFTGLFSGFLGAGGGFILVPSLIYIIGCKPAVAAGTSIFEIFLSCMFAAASHATKGNVDVSLAILMFAGSLMGLQIGISATKYVKEKNFKIAFGLCLAFTSLSVILKMAAWASKTDALYLLSQTIIFMATFLTALLIIVLTLQARYQVRS
ncbi:sulfite exporter TauE/SafE family protein [Candidatus Bathyarchaeota archaeon]|nr:sulfite exporter TauE/SafE family protein [Candidatus Bathyarchaeota archaeon]